MLGTARPVCTARACGQPLSRTLVFESLRSTIDDLLGGRVHPDERRNVINGMKQALVLAKLQLWELE